ncbi:unnamed protein product [Schistosoma rodhaini]|uniref:Uncharacterized protein n=1 Tax=Schistosoma rodhaini TaxID=6188 RepID=A0AA85FA90_9TREM|nr:unnamed protein product [Schistosoma rodhaini]
MPIKNGACLPYQNNQDFYQASQLSEIDVRQPKYVPHNFLKTHEKIWPLMFTAFDDLVKWSTNVGGEKCPIRRHNHTFQGVHQDTNVSLCNLVIYL